ncbi:MAG: acylphosphatase [Actinomycetota bacterium]|nr:acylphosphatase [Actinomycetota bacterium]
MAENIKTYKVILSGRVQGVGFRFFVESVAGKYDIKGYVRNTVNGKVEVVCQGEDGMDQFLEEIKKGPSFSVVADVKIEEFESSKKYNVFEIRY